MIEMLCVSAEITAALLILSIFLPIASRKSRQNGSYDSMLIDSQAMQESLASLRVLRTILFMQSARWINRTEPMQNAGESPSTPIENLAHHLVAVQSLFSQVGNDSSVQLGDRSQIEQELTTWNEWSPWFKAKARVGIVQLDHLDQLDEKHGAIAHEIAYRHIGELLRNRLSGIGYIAGFNHQAFSVALLGWSEENSIEFLESIRFDVQKEIFTIGENDVSVSASASLVEYETDSKFESLWEQLEDGIVEAVSAGANRGRWFDKSNDCWKPMGIEDAVAAPSTESSDNSSAETEADADAMVTDEMGKHSLSDSANSATVSGAADSPSIPKSDSAPQAIESNQAVSSDDISALFSAAKANKPKIASSASDATRSPTLETEAEPPKVTEPNEENKVSNNDIEALFKFAKPPTKTESSKPASKESTSDAITVTSKPAEENSKASNEDIEALFKAVQTKKKPSITAVDESTQSATTFSPEPAPQEKSVAQAEADGPTTADDIAALFKAAQEHKTVTPGRKPAAQAPSEDEEPTPTKPVTPSDDEIDTEGKANNDDIEALFAAFKKPAKPS